MDSSRIALTVGAVFFLSMAGGLLPLMRRWNQTAIRMLLAFGIVIVLAAVAAALQEFGLGIPRAVALLAAAAIAGASLVLAALSGLGVI